MHRRQLIAGVAGGLIAHGARRRPAYREREPLWQPPAAGAGGLVLRAGVHPVSSGGGMLGTAWAPGDGLIGPTIRARRGDLADIRLENTLAEPTILHWHGLSVPEEADGHPRLAIGPGERYRYRFEIIDRAATYWYHAHPHHRTGPQVYRGMAGLLLVGDDEEDALELPSGDREIPILIQDRRIGPDGEFRFDPVMHERMEGFLGEVPFGNGTPEPFLDVVGGLHRLRVVNVTASRIVRLGLSNGARMTLIGGDGGLLPAPVPVTSVDLGTGERVDLLVDFSDVAEGESVMLRSLAFDAPVRGMGMGMGRMRAGGVPQGGVLDLLEFRIVRRVREAPWVAPPFPALPEPDPARAVRVREFRFQSAMMRHTINGREFDLDRIDERVRFGTSERWRFLNDSPFPHPVHMHEGQFRVLSRTGGRGRLFPWEAGLKDTVLVLPGEAVEVLATFDRYRGRYLMHCHNLVHEDLGMMVNYAIE